MRGVFDINDKSERPISGYFQSLSSSTISPLLTGLTMYFIQYQSENAFLYVAFVDSNPRIASSLRINPAPFAIFQRKLH